MARGHRILFGGDERGQEQEGHGGTGPAAAVEALSLARERDAKIAYEQVGQSAAQAAHGVVEGAGGGDFPAELGQECAETLALNKGGTGLAGRQ
jgi:hypothetical protein